MGHVGQPDRREDNNNGKGERNAEPGAVIGPVLATAKGLG